MDEFPYAFRKLRRRSRARNGEVNKFILKVLAQLDIARINITKE